MSSSARGARLPGVQFAQRSGARYWVSAWLPVVVGIIVIAIESTEAFGSNHTSGPLRILYEALFGRVSDASWDVIHHYVRKSGHFIGYGLIGLAWLRAWWMTVPRARFFTDAAMALFGTALIATCDEWHQRFLPNRTSSPWDVLLDCCGAIVMIGAAFLVLRLRSAGKLARARRAKEKAGASTQGRMRPRDFPNQEMKRDRTSQMQP